MADDRQIPDNLMYTETHEWILKDGDTITIGITEYAQSELGDIVYVELPVVGKAVDQEEAFGTIEAVKTVEDLLAPVAGEVVEINDTLETHPEQINTDPYGDGWMVKLQLADPSELEGLLDPRQYAELLNGG
jgi:glycine cleavage system H protein